MEEKKQENKATGRPRSTSLRERKHEVKVRFNDVELALIRKRAKSANYRQLSPFLRDSGKGQSFSGRLSVEERNLIYSLKQDLNDLQRLRNLIAKEQRGDLLVGLDLLQKRLKKRLDDWQG